MGDDEPGAQQASPDSVGLGPDQARLEAGFGVGLGDVEVVRGDAAAELAADEGAVAYAEGDQLVLPTDDPHVLAHEAAHVVQQGGGTGGEGDAEEAADAAATAFVHGEALPPQPAAPVSVAKYQGPAPVRPPVGRAPRAPISGYGTGGAAPGLTTDAFPVATSGWQHTDELEQAFETAELRAYREKKKVEQEKPRVVVDGGGGGPTFITEGPPSTYQTTYPGTGQILTIEYTPHKFHIFGAILYDISLATSENEIEAVWEAYMRPVAKRPPPWAYRRELRLMDAKPMSRMPVCDEDGPGYWEDQPRVGKVTLPDGAAAIGFGMPGLFGPEPGEDADGSLRAMVMHITIASKVLDDKRFRGLAQDMGLNERTRTADPGNEKDKKDPATLYLPLAKSPHFSEYQSLASGGRLVHDPGYARGSTDQRSKWKAELAPGGADGIHAGAYADGLELMSQSSRNQGQILLPEWSRVSSSEMFHVDHVIELQLLTPGDRGWANSISNFELLDASANQQSGGLIQAAVERERQRLGTPPTATLSFERVALSGGDTGQRWSPQEIRSGEHLKVLRRMLGLDEYVSPMDQ